MYFSLSIISSNLLHLPTPQQVFPTCFQNCAISTCTSIVNDFLDHVPSFLFARNATTLRFSINRIFWGDSITALAFSYRKCIATLVTYFLELLHAERASSSLYVSSWRTFVPRSIEKLMVENENQ